MEPKYDSMYKQALDIITKMGLSPERLSKYSPMWEFKYKDIPMCIDTGFEHNEFVLSCPINLYGTEEEQKDTLETAKYMTADDLPDFDIYYIGDDLACISWYLQVKETRHILHKKQLISSLDKMRDSYFTIEAAISMVMLTKEPEFIASIDVEK